MLDGLPSMNGWFTQSPPDPHSHDKGSTTARVRVSTHRRPLSLRRQLEPALSQHAHTRHTRVYPHPETKLESGTRDSALCANDCSLPRPLLMVTRGHPLSSASCHFFLFHSTAWPWPTPTPVSSSVTLWRERWLDHRECPCFLVPEQIPSQAPQVRDQPCQVMQKQGQKASGQTWEP